MKNLLTAMTLVTIIGAGATTAAEAYCGPTCRQGPCMARVVRVETAPVCAPCNPCCDPCDPCERRGWRIFPWNW